MIRIERRSLSVQVGMLVVLAVIVVSCVPRSPSLCEAGGTSVYCTVDDSNEGWGIRDGSSRDIDQGFGLFLYHRVDTTVVRFAGFWERDRELIPRWKKLDQIRISLQGHTVWVGNGACACYIDDVHDPELFALMEGERTGKKLPLKVWRANRKTERIEEINVRGVHCVCQSILNDVPYPKD